MGKSQKKRAMRRHNPMRVPDSHLPHGLASASSASTKTDAVLPIMKKMESADPVERKWACVAVSNLIYNDPSTRRLLQGKNVVGTLIGRLTDPEEEVVVEAAGALRNLCIDGGYDICAEMYNKNILAPLRTFIPKISTTLAQYLDSPKTAPESAQKVVYEFAENVITILWCLSETSNRALHAVNALALVPFLMAFLAARARLPPAPVAAAAQCLYVLTDDNAPVADEVRANFSHVACLLDIARADAKGKTPAPAGADASEERAAALGVLACGILRNLAPFPPPSALAALDLDREVILPVLVPVLTSVSLPAATDAVQGFLRAQAEEEPAAPAKPDGKHPPRSDHRSEAERGLEHIEARLRTVQLALEILTGVCATLPDPDLEPGVEDDVDADADVDGDDVTMDMAGDDAMALDDDAAPPPNAPPPLHAPAPAAFLPALLEPLLALIQPTPLSFPAPSPHAPTTSALAAIHTAALECLSNAFLALAAAPGAAAADAAAGQRVWSAVWAALAGAGAPGDAAPGSAQGAVWDTAAGVLWGVGSVWPGKIDFDDAHVGALVALCDARAANEAVRVKCVGALGALAQHPRALDANRAIAAYLLGLLAPGAPGVGTETLLQAASALIDVFADEGAPAEANFRAGGVLAALAGAVEGVRRAVRGIDRKKEGGRELRRYGEEVRDNLVAFVQYRRELGV